MSLTNNEMLRMKVIFHTLSRGDYRHNSTLSLTSAPDGSGWVMPLPSVSTPEKETRHQRIGGWMNPSFILKGC